MRDLFIHSLTTKIKHCINENKTALYTCICKHACRNVGRNTTHILDFCLFAFPPPPFFPTPPSFVTVSHSGDPTLGSNFSRNKRTKKSLFCGFCFSESSQRCCALAPPPVGARARGLMNKKYKFEKKARFKPTPRSGPVPVTTVPEWAGNGICDFWP